MTHPEATTQIRTKPRCEEPVASISDEVFSTIALVALTHVQRAQPVLHGPSLRDAVVKHIRTGVVAPEEETAVFASLYPLVFPAFGAPPSQVTPVDVGGAGGVVHPASVLRTRGSIVAPREPRYRRSMDFRRTSLVIFVLLAMLTVGCAGAAEPADAGTDARCRLFDADAFSHVLLDFMEQAFPYLPAATGLYVAPTSMHGRDLSNAYAWELQGLHDADVACANGFYLEPSSTNSAYFSAFPHQLITDSFAEALVEGTAVPPDYDELAYTAAIAVGHPIYFPEVEKVFFMLHDVSAPPDDTDYGRLAFYKNNGEEWGLVASEPVQGFAHWVSAAQ